MQLYHGDFLRENSIKKVGIYFEDAKKILDLQFGEGVSEKNPALVIEVSKLIALDFIASATLCPAGMFR